MTAQVVNPVAPVIGPCCLRVLHETHQSKPIAATAACCSSACRFGKKAKLLLAEYVEEREDGEDFSYDAELPGRCDDQEWRKELQQEFGQKMIGETRHFAAKVFAELLP